MSVDIAEHEVAIHEAGHAVVAYALGEQFEHISTEGMRDRTRGHVAFVNWFDPNAPLSAEQCERAARFVIVMLAGKYTHRRWHERTVATTPDRDLLAKTAHLDELQIIRLTNSLGRVEAYGTDMHAIREALQHHLDVLVACAGDGYWLRVEALAAAVQGGRTLSWEMASNVLSTIETHNDLSPLFDSWRSTALPTRSIASAAHTEPRVS